MSTELTQARLKELLHYDPETGVFTWRTKVARTVTVGSPAGYTRKDGYLKVTFFKRSYLGQRLAFLYVKGYWPSCEIDHRDGDPSNNTWLNLREGIHAENLQNCKPRGNASGVTGVGWHKLRQKWRATITVFGKQIHAGLFDTKEEAIAKRAWLKANLHTFQPVQRGEYAS